MSEENTKETIYPAFLRSASQSQVISYLQRKGCEFRYRSTPDAGFGYGMWSEPKHPLEFYVKGYLEGIYELAIHTMKGLPTHLEPADACNEEPVGTMRMAAIGETVHPGSYEVRAPKNSTWVKGIVKWLVDECVNASIAVPGTVPWHDWDGLATFAAPKGAQYASELKSCRISWYRELANDCRVQSAVAAAEVVRLKDHVTMLQNRCANLEKLVFDNEDEASKKWKALYASRSNYRWACILLMLISITLTAALIAYTCRIRFNG